MNFCGCNGKTELFGKYGKHKKGLENGNILGGGVTRVKRRLAGWRAARLVSVSGMS